MWYNYDLKKTTNYDETLISVAQRLLPQGGVQEDLCILRTEEHVRVHQAVKLVKASSSAEVRSQSVKMYRKNR